MQHHDSRSSAAPSSNALAVPELLLIISSFLRERDLCQCLFVNRLFYSICLPQVWSSIELQVGLSAPSLEDLVKNASFVQRLEITGESQVDLIAQSGILFPALFTLKVNLQVDDDTTMSKESLLLLIQRHQPTIRSLWLNVVTSEEILDAIRDCSVLDQLEIMVLMLTTPERLLERYFASLWSRLCVLKLGRVWFSDSKNVDDNRLRKETATPLLKATVGTTDNRIQVLNMQSYESNQQLLRVQQRLILDSPNLKKLRWIYGQNRLQQSPMNWLAERFQHVATTSTTRVTSPTTITTTTTTESARFCSQLESLALPFNHFSNQDLAVVLRSITTTNSVGLTSLDLSMTNFALESWRILKRDFPETMRTLTSLNVYHCLDVSGAMVHDILCSIVCLEELKCNYIKIADLDEFGSTSEQLAPIRPWACKDTLKRLKMSVVMDKNGLQAGSILARLGALTRLQTLDLEMYRWPGGPMGSQWRDMRRDGDPSLPLQLLLTGVGREGGEHLASEDSTTSGDGGGLKYLRHLRQLNCFHGSSSHSISPAWGAAEARWVLQHWVNLECISSVTMNMEAMGLFSPRKDCVISSADSYMMTDTRRDPKKDTRKALMLDS
ncbi:hypothetical protein BGZ83_003750 [Gryganskiella cystojenkinii]|nr:hypothetical protein BGZ83_003750 [Gryganskiella cystojenkinii]